jgi:hypothetical protein
MVLGMSAAAFGQSGGGYDLSWSTIDGGGGTSSGGGYELTGTIGQPDASAPNAMAGGTFQLTGGFWVPHSPTCVQYAPADFDHDCDVDGSDLEDFIACLSAPEVPHSGAAACLPADFDLDGDIDHVDYGIFQKCYSGPNYLADPDCAN